MFHSGPHINREIAIWSTNSSPLSNCTDHLLIANYSNCLYGKLAIQEYQMYFSLSHWNKEEASTM